MKKSGIILLAGFLALILISGCADNRANLSPKDVVIKLFGAMERNDRAAIPHLVNLVALMNNRDEDYALQADTPRVFRNPEDILDDLTGSGLTKSRWFSMQRVIGQTELVGDTAYVEVSFIDKQADVQYYNKFGLAKSGGIWKIFSFKTLSDTRK
ncbi:conserved hypothetical protein [Candidatus Zixiibacteriota bacterium]|nr:conserved hypothetical protein [candidate division Zixibacteria bacterium]